MSQQAKGARLWADQAKGYWFIRDGSIKRSTGCRLADREGADKALADYIGTKYQPPRPSEGDPVTVSDVLIFYGNTRGGHRSHQTTGHAIQHLARWWGDRLVSDIKGSTCRAYVDHRMQQRIPQAKTSTRTVSEATAARELNVLRAALHAWHAEHPLPALPVVTVPPRPASRERFLERAEVARLLRGARTIEDRDARRALCRFILLGVYTGTRSGALRDLGWHRNTLGGWVDLDRGVIHRRPDGEQETKKRKPPCRIPARLLPFLRRWKAIDEAAGRSFLISYRGEPVEKQRRSWEKARTAAGLGPDVVPHVLRHTAVTWLLQQGVSAWDVGGFVGMSPAVIESTYGHHHADYQAEVATALLRRARR